MQVVPGAVPGVAPGAAPAAVAAPAPAAPPPAALPEVDPLPNDVVEVISKSTATMDRANKQLADISAIDGELGKLRDDVDKVISSTTRAADSLRPRLDEIKTQINKLGPAPKEGEPAEGAPAAAERARLLAEQSQVSGAIKTLEVTWLRARKAIEKITEVRLELFVKSLTQRMTKPFLTDVSDRVANDWPSVNWRIHYNIDDWTRAIGRQIGPVTILAGAAALLYFLLKSIALWIVRIRSRERGPVRLTFFEKAFAASWTAPMRALPGVATALLVYFGLDYLGLLYYPTSSPAGGALLFSTLIFIGVAALLTSVFSPNQPERRLVEISNRSARRISRLLKSLAFIYAADLFMSEIGQVLYFPLSLSILQSIVTSLAFALVLVGLILTPFEPHDGVARGSIGRFEPAWIKIPLALAAAAILIACLSGYVSLARFLAHQIVMSGVIALVGTLLYLAIRAFTRENNGDRTVVSLYLEEKFGFDAPRRRQLGSIVEMVLTSFVVLLLAPLLLLQWGFTGVDVKDMFKTLFFGFEIGTIRISLFRIMVGVGLFIGLLFATRLLQRRLRTTVLNRPKLDPGIANSVDKAVGYVGIILATLIAVSYAGFDVTNFAIVAGALGVGIGFGLQSIVNNFVSGLILLIERPIKVGDWIVVGNEQGIVKNISVRSTEIETFARASLIIPNSELVAGRVLNLTHRNALGRVDLNFTTGLDEDPNKIIAILHRIAEDHPDVLREPAPIALFEGYTATATEYSLRFYLPDIGKGLRIRSDIRVAVYRAFRDAGIEMPVTTSVKTPTPVVGPVAD